MGRHRKVKLTIAERIQVRFQAFVINMETAAAHRLNRPSRRQSEQALVDFWDNLITDFRNDPFSLTDQKTHAFA